MTQLSKENIAAVADLKPGYRLGATDVAILQEMARRQLASEVQVPVADAVLWEHWQTPRKHDVRWRLGNDAYIGPLYAAPTAQPVQVPDAEQLLLRWVLYAKAQGSDLSRHLVTETEALLSNSTQPTAERHQAAKKDLLDLLHSGTASISPEPESE